MEGDLKATVMNVLHEKSQLAGADCYYFSESTNDRETCERMTYI